MTNTIKKVAIKTLAFLNAAEGIIHLSVSAIAFWGIYDTETWDWRIMTAPTADLFLGCVSLVTGWLLNDLTYHHH